MNISIIKVIIKLFIFIPFCIMCIGCGTTQSRLFSYKTQNPSLLIASEYGAIVKSGGLLNLPIILMYNEPENAEKAQFLYDSNDAITFKFIYSYDKSGDLVEGSIYNSNGKKISNVVYEYDSQNRLIKKLCYVDSVLSIYSKYKYNDLSQRISGEAYLSDDDLISKVEYKYNRKGRLSEAFEYGNEGKLYSKYTYTYGFDGRLKKAIKTNRKNKLEKYCLYEYRKPKLVKETLYDSSVEMEKYITYSYYSKSSLLDKIYIFSKIPAIPFMDEQEERDEYRKNYKILQY